MASQMEVTAARWYEHMGNGSLTDNSRWGSRRGGDRRKENV